MAILKKGDKVRVLKTLHGHTFHTGEIVTIVHPLRGESPEDIEGYQCENERGQQSAVGVEEIELHQARVPTVGDKAKVLPFDDGHHGFKAGDIVEFTGFINPLNKSLEFYGERLVCPQRLKSHHYEWI